MSLPAPRPWDAPRALTHADDCGCRGCAADRAVVPPALTWVDLARLALLGLMLGGFGAAALAPLRSTAAVAALLGGQ